MNNLRAEMVRHEITIKKLAELIGISQQALSEKLNSRTEFKLSEVRKILQLFREMGSEFTLEYLFYPDVQNNGLQKGA